MLKKLLFFTLFLLPTAVFAAENNLGFGLYALLHPKFPCEAVLKAFEPASTIRFAYLATTFGDDRTCLNKLLSDPRPKEIEVILFNYNCVKWDRCGSYEVLFGESEDSLRKKLRAADEALKRKLLDAARLEAEKLKPFLSNKVTLFVSPMLEHKLGSLNEAAIDAVKEAFPNAFFVDNPLANKLPVSNAHLVERHGENPPVTPQTILNLDGTDAFEIDLPQYIERGNTARMNLLWIYEMNGRCRPEGEFIDPRLRTCFPKEDQLQTLARYVSQTP